MVAWASHALSTNFFRRPKEQNHGLVVDSANEGMHDGAWHSIGHSQDAFFSSSINFHAIFLLQSESRGHHRSTLATFLNPPLNGALDVSLPFGSAGRPWQERPDRASNGRTDGWTGEGGSGQRADGRCAPVARRDVAAAAVALRGDRDGADQSSL